ncbi:MAG: PEP-CTERM sorting domain-containing protein [Planctomycetota bacterium]
MKTRIFMSVIVSVYILFISTVQGVVIPLSTHSSEPNSVPASWLDASMNLSVHNSAQWALTVAVTNLTPENTGDFAFKMTEIYFNTTAPITNLTLIAVSAGDASDWTLTLDMDNIQADGFGLFDISIISNDVTSVWIDPLETLTFGIFIDAGTPPYTDTDFFDLSFQNDGHILAYGAAKFAKTGDPGDLSAYGAYVPEPASILMLGLGALALIRKR